MSHRSNLGLCRFVKFSYSWFQASVKSRISHTRGSGVQAGGAKMSGFWTPAGVLLLVEKKESGNTILEQGLPIKHSK